MSEEIVGWWILDLAITTGGDKFIASPAEMLLNYWVGLS